MAITHIRGLITPLVATHEPPSTVISPGRGAALNHPARCGCTGGGGCRVKTVYMEMTMAPTLLIWFMGQCLWFRR